MKHDTSLEAALAWARQGFPVFPVGLDRRPLFSGKGNGLKLATCEEDSIQRWYRDHPYAGVAVALPEHIVVLDEDVKPKNDGTQRNGAATRIALEATLGALPRTFTVRTGSGGAHRWFTVPPGVGVKNGTERLGNGLDQKTIGGYVVVPPSANELGVYIVEDDCDFAELPPKWIDAMRRPPRQARPHRGRPVGDREPTSSTARERAVVRLREFAERVAEATEGTRNDTLNTSAFQCGALVREGLVEREVVADALVAACRVNGLVASHHDAEAQDDDNEEDGGSTEPEDGLSAVLATIDSGLIAGIENGAYRPEIVVIPDEGKMIEAGVEILGRTDGVYSHAGRLTTVVGSGEPGCEGRILPLAAVRVREWLAVGARWVRYNKDDEPKPALVPEYVPTGVLARGEWPVPVLQGIGPFPIVISDGTIINRRGYVAAARVFVIGRTEIGEFKENPTHDDARGAVTRLVDVFRDFPFAECMHFSVVVAGILTPLARHSFDGPAPFFLVDGNQRGVGKGLLLDVIGTIVLGHPMARKSNPHDDEEARKFITSIALAGETMVCVDNIVGSLGCPSLDLALTARTWSDRKLGVNETVTLPLDATWYGNGNNVDLNADTARRTLHSRLITTLERPESRTDVARPRLLKWCRENRPALLGAALTILRAWYVAGCPRSGLPPVGSFEGWCDAVRDPIVWAGLPDPCATREALLEQRDRSAELHERVLDLVAWADPSGVGIRVRDLLSRVQSPMNVGFSSVRDHERLLDDLGLKRGGTNAVGQRIAQYEDRPLGGRALSRVGPGRAHDLWRVVPVRGAR